MPTVCCVCDNCGKIFYSKDELYLPAKAQSKMRFANKRQEMTSWEDWLLHCSSNCEDCRLKEVPVKCIENYKKLKGG